MKEENYEKWLKAKSEVEHFDELPDEVKKTIYDIEQGLDEEWEVELDQVLLEEQEVYFTWEGFEKEVERLQRECGYDEDKAYEIADTQSADVLQDYIFEFVSDDLEDWIIG